MVGHVAEIVGHDPETAGHVRPKYARTINDTRPTMPETVGECRKFGVPCKHGLRRWRRMLTEKLSCSCAIMAAAAMSRISAYD
jgi:hypothetical protein